MAKRIVMALAVASVILLGNALPSMAWHLGWHHYRHYYSPYYPFNPYYPYGHYGPFLSPPVVVPPAQPQTYIEQPRVQYWYWCSNPAGYYPYIQSCTVGWMQVVPQTTPPGAPR